MKHATWAALLLALSVQLPALSQPVKPRSSPARPRARASRPAPAPRAVRPAEIGLVVPSWLPAAAPVQPAATVVHDLLDTWLDLRFDYSRQHVLGTAVLTLRPHFYPQNQLLLDAKGFDIGGVQLLSGKDEKTLPYKYDDRQLTIALDRYYARTETYQVRIVYVAKPNELPRGGGSAAIIEDKGLYFINPTGQEPGKPRQIWTQGETESASCWFPTIDKPNQRMTQEIRLTVEPQFKTLSNGLLISSQANPDGTRTDTWRQTLPHAPYLAMLAVGEFAVVSDTWRGKSVDYYVEPKYQGTARAVFGRTPEMLEFYSRKLGVDFPWEKYAQVAVRDYVSGAMENTTATVHGAGIQATRRELVDQAYDTGESTIAHELFHQWFGDYVTNESWANLPLNESFADYSELLWAEYKYGPDQAALVQQIKLNNYLEEAQSKREPLIRYQYAERESMFDHHSYDKGGRVLHMLRYYVGDEAFFAALNRYLTQNKLSAVELARLRLAFEETTGEDLNWFFDQWFLQRGHPELKVTHSYVNGQVRLRVRQVQDTVFSPIFRLPVRVAVWTGGQATEYQVNVTRTDQTFTFPSSQPPQLVKLDPAGQLLAQLDEERSREELVFQYQHARGYLQKYEALDLLHNQTREPAAAALLQQALTDPFWAIRRTALDHLRRYQGPEATLVQQQVQRLATADPSPRVRAQALATLATFAEGSYGSTFMEALRDSSYTVNAAALTALGRHPDLNAARAVAALDSTSNGTLLTALAGYYAKTGGPAQLSWFLRRLPAVPENAVYEFVQQLGTLLAHLAPAERKAGEQALAELARRHPRYYVRLAAFQGLAELVPGSPELKKALQDIKAQETDSRLQAFYKMM